MAKEGFVAHIFDTIRSDKRSRASTYEKIKNFKKGTNFQVQFKRKATNIQLIRIREKIQQENKKALQKNIILITILILLLIYVIGFVKF
ncbi:MAG: hypothetical protein GW772_10830 [Flavobacteriia bacterium]|nr:hypothetical protein [Flavobacteriia bacterium]OIP47002.1 MAG: hypothetical protein AUK46_06840 [Flavobacteriaceae bacterium CG2_30_31_66]PIV96584.1 MAG: hypothetical protein COW43_07435 [Flavobacteriaceae bacterium CG17_big_fil_post_rev_8_21_14_2_50_31_13]PIX10985.1 MAG: hypothetical protein COZ74_15150 [Flavobacteriaceae bacterium CG_4_8_14_3_um_filter_31_8]PIY13869.1 MAG: hypothetical protein COZ16_12020 [Flavobacteriaceae bacterium CG_4_10_14_3_um_filter_31_253]PIZ10570.1 MAG: hypotheti